SVPTEGALDRPPSLHRMAARATVSTTPKRTSIWIGVGRRAPDLYSSRDKRDSESADPEAREQGPEHEPPADEPAPRERYPLVPLHPSPENVGHHQHDDGEHGPVQVMEDRLGVDPVDPQKDHAQDDLHGQHDLAGRHQSPV